MLTVKSLSKTVLAVGALVLGGVSANAQTFAQQNTTTSNPFQFLNTGTTATSGLVGVGAASAAVASTLQTTFYFTSVSTALGFIGGAGLTGPVNSVASTLTINNASATGPASPLTPAGNFDQPLIDTTFGPTFKYTNNVPFAGLPAGSNLLSVFLQSVPANSSFFFSAEAPVAGNPFSGQTASIIQSTGSGGIFVTYSSDFLNLTNQTNQNFGYTFIDASSQNSIGPNGVLATNTYNATAIFSLNVTRSAVPEPGTVAMLVGMGTTGLGLLARRRRK